MGRKKKKSERGKIVKNTGAKEAESGKVNFSVDPIDNKGNDLANSPKTEREANSVYGIKKGNADVKENSERKSLKDATHKRRFFGRRRIPSQSPRRRGSRQEEKDDKQCEKALVTATGEVKKRLSGERMSRKETFYADNPEKTKHRTSQADEEHVTATVDSLDEEMGHGKIKKERKSRRDLVNSTITRRRLLSKSPFKLSHRCHHPSCLGIKEQNGDKNSNQVELEMSTKQETTQTQENLGPIRDEMQIKGKSKRSVGKGKNFIKRRRQRRIDKRLRAESQEQEKTKAKKSIMNCCGVKKKTPKAYEESESGEDDYPPEKVSDPFSLKSKASEANDGGEVKSVSKTEPEEVKSSNISPENYPEELNPFADEPIMHNTEVRNIDLVNCADHTINVMPRQQKESNKDEIKTLGDDIPGETTRDDYPEHLNPFANDDETNDSTRIKENQKSENVVYTKTGKNLEVNVLKKKATKSSVDIDIQKSTFAKRWSKFKAKGHCRSKKTKGGNKEDNKSRNTMTNTDKPGCALVSTVDKDTDLDRVMNKKKIRKWRPSWRKWKAAKYKLTNQKTKHTDVTRTVSKRNSATHAQEESATSLTIVPDVTDRDDKTWRHRLHLKKKKSSGKKQKNTDTHQSESAYESSKFKTKKKRRRFKLRRKRKSLNREKMEILTEQASEIMEDDKVAFKSKYLQDLNPLTAAHHKASKQERRIPKSKLKSMSDIKIKQRRWWKFGKRQKHRDREVKLSKKNATTNDKLVDVKAAEDQTDSPKKKLTILKRVKKALLKPRSKPQSTTNSESTQVVCDSASDKDKKSSTERTGAVNIKTDKKREKSDSKTKAGLKESEHRKLRPTLTKLRNGWKKFNQWLDE